MIAAAYRVLWTRRCQVVGTLMYLFSIQYAAYYGSFCQSLAPVLTSLYIHTYIYIYIYTYYIYYFFLTENQRKPMTYPHSFQTALIHTNVSFLLAVLVLSNGYHLPCHSLLQTVNAACLLQWTFTSNHHLTLPQGVKGYVLGCLEQQSDNLWMVRPVLLCGVYFLPAILHIYCFYNKSIFKCYSGFLNLSIKIRQDLLQQDKCMLYKSHIFITIMYFFIIYKFL